MRLAKYILISVYGVFALLLTVSLFTFNEFSNSSLGNTTILGIKEEVGKLKKGDLVIASKKEEAVKENNKIYYYDTSDNKKEISASNVNKIMKTKTEYTYVVENNLFLSSEYLIGREEDLTKIPVLGYIYNAFTSKVGYFLCVILPIVLCLIFQIFKYRKNI